MPRSTRRILPALLVAGLLLPACASRRPAPAPEPAAPVEPMQPGHAPTPFSAAQIRDRCVTGHRRVWRIESPGMPPVLSTMVFVETDAEGALLRSRVTTLDGAAVGDAQQARGSWEKFRGHASFPADRTTIEPAEAVTPAGTFDCLLYTVTDGESVTRLWFAKDHAGPPVRMERMRGEALAMVMSLVSMDD